jgi:hypothetical protein
MLSPTLPISSRLSNTQRLAPIVSKSDCSRSRTCRIASAGASVRQEPGALDLHLGSGAYRLQTMTRVVFPAPPVLLDGLLVHADGLEHAFVGCTGGVQKRRLGIVENAEPRRRLDHRQRHIRKVHCHRNLSITVARLAMDD